MLDAMKTTVMMAPRIRPRMVSSGRCSASRETDELSLAGGSKIAVPLTWQGLISRALFSRLYSGLAIRNVSVTTVAALGYRVQRFGPMVVPSSWWAKARHPRLCYGR